MVVYNEDDIKRYLKVLVNTIMSVKFGDNIIQESYIPNELGRQTQFGNELKAFLKKITINCNNYIDSVFNNLSHFFDITCPHYSISNLSNSGLYDKIKTVVFKTEDDKEGFILTFLDLLEKVPMPVSPYKTYIRSFKNDYLKELEDNKKRQQEFQDTLEEAARRRAIYELKPKTYTEAKQTYYDTAFPNYTQTDRYRISLSDDVEYNLAKQILSRYQYISGIWIINKKNGDPSIIPKKEENYEDFDYFLILKDRNIEDGVATVSTYEKYLQAKLSLDYLLSIEDNINLQFKFYEVENLPPTHNEKEKYIIDRPIMIKKYNDFVAFKAQYKKDISEYKESLKLKELYMREKEKLRKQLETTTDTLNEKSFYELCKIKDKETQLGGGNAKITKKSNKSILGKERCIYKKAGDRKEYLRYKGDLITVRDYTKLMKAKAAKA